MRSSFRALAGGSILLVALLGARGDAQQPSQAPPSAPADPQRPPADQAQQPLFKTGINFVRVDVIVTDRNGNTVPDLRQSDFEVVEDSKPQTIESFKLVKLDGGAVPTADGPPRPIRTDSDEELEAARDDVRLFAIFLDDYHVRRGASLSVRAPLSSFIETQLGPSDMLGLMYPLESLSSLRMTRNHDAVSRGVQQFLGRKFEYEPKNEFEQRYMFYPTEIVERIRNQVSMSAIKGLITHLGSLKEGRKSLILVSEGFSNMLPPQMRDAVAGTPGYGNPNYGNPMAGLNDPNETRASFFASMDLQSDLQEIYATANRNNVSIYALDPRGLTDSEFDIADNINAQMGREYLNSTMDTLRSLAENTDGRAIVNRNDLATGLKQVVRDTSAYYLLGYNSTQAPSDGKFHEIKVRVKRPGVQVRARKGYWALNAEEVARATAPPRPARAPAVEAALATVNTPPQSRVIRSWIGTTRGENGKTKVTFVWEPVPKAPGDRQAASREQPARVSLMAAGADGSPYFRGRVPDVALASAAPAAAAVASGASAGPPRPARVSFEVKPGKMQLRVSVEGAGSEVLDSETREITIPDLTVPQTTLGTPELFRARTLREYQQLKGDATAVPIAVREFSRTDRLLIRVSAYGAGTSVPTLTARLLNRAGQPMLDLPVAVPASPSGEPQIELPLAGIAPGEYLVEIQATGEGGDAKELVGFRVTA
ncbi:MAG: hypothetical protein DMF92_03270 [Acidobacteria bacterium]|nr:MAG: hypothetical protein DMF92_03270 [Acidobacteriota bacterium]